MKKVTGKCRERYALRGSFTVETSLMMPVVLGVMFLALRLGYVFYDRTKVVAEELEIQEASDAVAEMYRAEKLTDIRGLIYGD